MSMSKEEVKQVHFAYDVSMTCLKCHDKWEYIICGDLPSNIANMDNYVFAIVFSHMLSLARGSVFRGQSKAFSFKVFFLRFHV